MAFSTSSKVLHVLSICFWICGVKATDTDMIMDAELLQQTTCLLPASSFDAYPLDQLPNWLNVPKLVRVKDHFGRENIVVNFLTVSGWAYGLQSKVPDHDAGNWYNEMCVSFLSEATDDFFGRVWPRGTKRRRMQQKFLQQARCLGGLKTASDATNTPLVQSAKVRVFVGGQRGGMVEWEQNHRGKGNMLEKLSVSGNDIEHTVVSVDDAVLLEQTLMYEIPDAMKHMWMRERGDLKLDLLMARTVRVEGSNVTSGAAVRMFSTEPVSLKARPVRVNLPAARRLMENFFPESPSFDIGGAKLHHCVSLDHMRPAEPDAALKKLRMFAHVERNQTAQSFFQRFSETESSTTHDAKTFGDSETGAPGTLTDLFDEIVWEVMQYPAAGIELVYHSRFRWFLAALDALYPFYAMIQSQVAGQYPSKRFRETKSHLALILCHIVSGSAVLYIGSFLHIDNAVKEVYEWDDVNVSWRRPLYYTFAICGALHSMTVWGVVSKVMGEKRITLPMYCSAGIVNLSNSIWILVSPTLENSFRLWGSMNVFIMVRFLVVVMIPLAIDWELLYTYVILAAGYAVYPATKQSEYVIFFLVVIPVLYGPFHERLAYLFGYGVEDELGENRTGTKNIKAYSACSCFWKSRRNKLNKKWHGPMQRLKSIKGIGKMEKEQKKKRRRAFMHAFMRMPSVRVIKETTNEIHVAPASNEDYPMGESSVTDARLEIVDVDQLENSKEDISQKIQVESC